MKKFLGLLVLVFVVFLTACGTDVIEAPDALVGLEVQVVSSESDYTSTDVIEVRNKGKVVASERNSVNRNVSFSLPRGDYTVSAQITGYKGTVYMEKEVTLAGDMNLLIDLTETAHYNYLEESLYGGGGAKEALLSISEGESSFDNSISLVVESVVLDANYDLWDKIRASNFYVYGSGINPRRWNFIPRTDTAPGTHDITVDIDFDVECVRMLGTYTISWNGEGVSKTQIIKNTPLCLKG